MPRGLVCGLCSAESVQPQAFVTILFWPATKDFKLQMACKVREHFVLVHVH